MGAITFTGLASGMDTSSWIEALVSIKQKSVTTLQNKQKAYTAEKNTVNKVKANVSSLRSSIEKITDSKFGGSFDVFAKNKVSASQAAVVTATATNDAARQNLEIVVNKLATATTATSNFGSTTLMSRDTNFSRLSSGNAVEGKFNVYVDGKKTEVEIEKDESMGSIIDKLNEIDGVSADIVDGKLSVNAESGHKLVIGSSSDESNFTAVTGLVRNEAGTGYESFNSISNVSTKSKLVDIWSDVDPETIKGTIKIGNAEITVDENTTLQSFISAINRNDDANATAYWDNSKGELVIKSKSEGAFNVNIEAGTSALTHLLGFTTGEKDEFGNYITDENGNYISSINQSTQVLGDYAELEINGSKLISSSNTVTSDISGINGLTLNLNSVSKPNDEGVVEPAEINITQDTDSLLDALKSFVNSYNSAISSIDENTAYGKDLYGDSALTSLRNNLRRTATSSLSDGTLKILAEIGISTGSANNTTDTSGVNKLKIDETKFKEALQKNPDAVKQLLVGDNKGNENSGGVLNKLETIVENSLTSVTGYFDKKDSSIAKSISNLDNSISNEQRKVDSYKARLQKQFNNMEQLISSMRNSYSQLTI